MKRKKTLFGILAVLLFMGWTAGCTGAGDLGESKAEPLNYLLYEKKGNMYYSALDGSDEILLAKNDSGEGWGLAEEYGALTTLSEDQKRLFYVEIEEGSMFDNTLYYRDVLKNGALSDARRITQNVSYYRVSANGQMVLTSSYEDERSRLYDLENDEKIDLGLPTYSCAMSKDGKRVVYSYYDSEKDRSFGYELEVGKEPEQIAKSDLYFVHSEEDLSSYYYMANGELYRKSFGKEEQLLVEDVFSVEKMYASGEFYFLRYDDQADGFDVRDFIIDDMAERDVDLEEVLYPEYPSREEFATDEEWETAYGEYVKLLELAEMLNGKSYREELREGFEGKPLESVNISLHFYDGKKEHLVAEFLPDDPETIDILDNVIYFEKEPGALIRAGFEFDDKVKLSELHYYDLSSLIQSAISHISSLYIADGAQIERVELPPAVDGLQNDYFHISKNEKSFYLIHNTSEQSDEFDLYRFQLNGRSVSQGEQMAQKIASDPFKIFSDGKVLYSTIEHRDGRLIGDIYLDERKLADSAYLQCFDEERETFVLLEEVDYESGEGTLARYEGYEPQEIDTKVRLAFINRAGNLFYYKNFDQDEWNGNLYFARDGEGELVSKGVSYIDPTLTMDDLAG